MHADTLRKRLTTLAHLLEFEMDGRYGNIDHYYLPDTRAHKYLLYFEGERTTEILVDSLDEAMTTPFLDGKSLAEAAEQLEIV